MTAPGRLSFAEVVSRLRGVCEGGDTAHVYARCPHPDHHDRVPSSSWAQTEDGIVLGYCFVCCPDLSREARTAWFRTCMAVLTDAPEVAGEALSYRALPKKDPRERRFVREYIYTVEGQKAYRKVRWDWVMPGSDEPVGKTFTWHHNRNLQRRDLLPAWMPDLPEDTDPGLYLIEQARPGGWITLCEGEHDAWALVGIGVNAVAVPHGAGTWRAAWGKALAGWSVAVLAHNDEAGLRHAERVRAELGTLVPEVRVGRPPDPFNDAADMIAAGLRPEHVVTVEPPAAAPALTKEEEKRGAGEILSSSFVRPVESRGLRYGLIGEIVGVIEPDTEADPVAVLVSLLAGASAMIGRGPHLMIANTRHPLTVWPLVFGRTADGRKGESWSSARAVLDRADALFMADNVASGLSSGEGLIARLGENEDRRLLVIEPEFSVVMARARREGNALPPALRDGWDGRPAMQVITRAKPLKVENPHLVVVAHVTPAEFRLRLAEADLAGGTYNRFLPVYVARKTKKPLATGMPEVLAVEYGIKLHDAIAAARTLGTLTLADDARPVYVELYSELADDAADIGRVEEFTARAAPYCLRIAGLYSALAGRRYVSAEDLFAAAEVVRYAMASVRYVLQRSLGDTRLDRLYAAIAEAGEHGLSRTEVSGLFSRNLRAEVLDELLGQVVEHGLVEQFSETTDGRPATRYRRTP